ncbi:kinase-like protein [Cadophora sp. DSE1049]|nr:kinase-like protein [Cadophora sp. DSE1049]
MTLTIGQVLRGRVASYHVIKVLKHPTVYQAQIVPFGNKDASQSLRLAAIKHFAEETSKSQYKRELHNYSFQSIAKSPFIRSMVDTIGHDENAATGKSQQPQCMLPRIVARSLLEALVVIDSEYGVHTDVNPNNVFVSDVHSSSPIVKLGDLGNLMSAGPMLKVRFQGVVIRAPEVWIDLPITPKADIWSVGVTLAHWLAGRTIFGPADKIVEDCVNHWCIAKLMRLVGPIPKPDASKEEIVDEFALAEYLANESFVHPQTGIEQKFISVGTIRQELEKVEGPIDSQCIGFIESLLTVDVERRPSAREALNRPWLRGEDRGENSDWSVD